MTDKRKNPLMLDKNNKVHENGEIIDIFDYVDRLKEKEYILDRMVEFANKGIANCCVNMCTLSNNGEYTSHKYKNNLHFGMVYESFIDLYDSLVIESEKSE